MSKNCISRTKILSYRSLFVFPFFLFLVNSSAASETCQESSINIQKNVDIVKNTGVSIRTKKFGTACLYGRKIKNPFPDAAYGIGPSGPNAPYIQFSIIKNGVVLYDLPRPPDWLWGTFDDAIISTAVVNRGGHQNRLFLIIGRTLQSNGSDAFQPLIYKITDEGFDLEIKLSKRLSKYDIYSTKDLIKKIQDLASNDEE